METRWRWAKRGKGLGNICNRVNNKNKVGGKTLDLFRKCPVDKILGGNKEENASVGQDHNQIQCPGTEGATSQDTEDFCREMIS